MSQSPVHEMRMAFVHPCEHRTPRIPLGMARIPFCRYLIGMLPICLCHSIFLPT